MAADGSIIIDTRIDTEGFVDLKKQLSGMASTAKKLGAAIVGAFSVRAVAQFAKECLDLGSDLQEVQNVVDVTFTTLNEQVNEFAKNAATTAGLSETMAKRYAGTFGAMAKAFGFAESEAYTMSTALTQLAGDVASFYNITQDEAYTKLKSVFTGETESLKDLGVVITQAALDSYALANGYGRTTAAMSEQEKVALRYKFVMDQLTAASGDFIRTSDGWANQTRLLSLQFEQLKATIGQGLINALTPVIKVINTILAGLQKLATAFAQFTSLLFGNAVSVSTGTTQEELSGIADGYEAAAGGAEDLAGATEKAGKAAKKYLTHFDEITRIGSDTSSTGGSSGGAGGLGGIGDFSFDATVGEANLKDNVSPQVEALVNKIRELIAPLQEIDFAPLKISLSGLGESFGELGSTIGNALGWAWENILVPLAKWTIEDAAPAALDVLSAALDVLNEVLIALQPLGLWLWENFLKPIAEWTGDALIDVIKEIADLFRDLSGLISGDTSFADFLANLTPVQTALTGIAAALIAVKAVFAGMTAFEAISGFFASIKALNATGLIGKIAEVFMLTASGAGSLSEAMSLVFGPGSIFAGIGAVVGGAVVAVTNFIGMLRDGFSWIKEALMLVGIAIAGVGAVILGAPAAVAAVVAGVVAAVATGIVLIKEHWAEIAGWFDDNVIQPVAAFFSKLWADISGWASETWENIVGFFSPAVEWFGELFESISQTVEDVFYNIGVIASGCWEIIKAVWCVVSDWFDTNIIQPISEFFTGVWDGIATGASNAWEGIKTAFSEVASFFQNTFSEAWQRVCEVFSPFGEIFVDIKDGILTAFKEIVNGIIRGINSVVRIPFEGINTALATIRGINILGLTPFSGLKTIAYPQIPYLAKGAVIPPNAPFMAMLGDQRHGTNVEAPLTTIQEAVAVVMSDVISAMLAGDEALLQELQELRATVENIQVGDSTIGEAADRYARRMALRTGGSA